MGETFTQYYGKWTITVWMSQKLGTWEFRASKGREYKYGTVEAWNRIQALDEVKLYLDESVVE